MPQLRVRVGPSPRDSDLTPIRTNTNEAYPVRSARFEGQVVVHIKGLPDEEGRQVHNDYFDVREDVTWSIQVQGRFLKPCTADDVLFGNTFDRPLKLPMGSSVALKFMKFIDPTLDHNLSSSTPWALSPLVSTMPHLMYSSTSPHSRSSSSSSLSSSSSGSTSPYARRAPAFPPNTRDLILDDRSPSDITLKAPSRNGNGKAAKNKDSAGERRKFFRDAENRRKVILGPEDTITTDFCYNFITFPDLRLCLPGGFSFDLARYWDGQPVRFVCCSRPRAGLDSGGLDPEDVFWCVSIEKVE